jgi:hypothetical protein
VNSPSGGGRVGRRHHEITRSEDPVGASNDFLASEGWKGAASKTSHSALRRGRCWDLPFRGTGRGGRSDGHSGATSALSRAAKQNGLWESRERAKSAGHDPKCRGGQGEGHEIQ